MSNKEQALETLQHAIELAKQSPSKEKGLNRLLLDRNLKLWHLKGAQETLSQIERDLREFPEATTVLLSVKKEILFDEGQFEQALSTVQTAEAQGVKLEVVVWDYLRIYDKLGRSKDGEKILQSFLRGAENQEDDFGLAESMALFLYHADQYQISKIIFQQILAIKPNRARSLNNLGFILTGEKQWTEAERLFKQALEYRFEDSAITQTNLGYIYLHQQKYPEAIQALETAQKQALSRDVEAVLHVACWYKNEISDTPNELFSKRSISTLLAVRANLATAYYLNSQPDQALAMAQTAIETDPKDNIGYRILGCLYLANGEVKAAWEAWKQALKLRKSKAEAELIQSWLADLPSPKN